jgi:hypothetical protein
LEDVEVVEALGKRGILEVVKVDVTAIAGNNEA